MRYFGHISSVLIIVMLFSCDSDRFLSYNYQAQSVIKITEITGSVTHRFTARPVSNATITIENQSTITDQNGDYEMSYQMSSDAELGRAIPIRINAENFFELESPQVLLPEPIQLNYVLEYAAPIIDAAAIVDATVCQALITDYQGPQDVVSVNVKLHYKDPATGTTLGTVDVPMNYVGQHATNVHRFQIFVPVGYPVTVYGDFIIVTARDSKGYVDELRHVSNPRNPDTLLFPDAPPGILNVTTPRHIDSQTR